MKLKYIKTLILVLTLTTLSSCWWDSDDDYIDVPNLVYYHWVTDFNNAVPREYSVFIFKENGFGVEELWTDNSGRPYDFKEFQWDWRTRRGTNFIELDYGRNADIEILYDVRINRRRATMEATHYLNPIDFEYYENGMIIFFDGE